jgi:hypothetical protein
MVLEGKCSEEEKINTFGYVTCNPQAESNSIPIDQTIMLFLVPTGMMVYSCLFTIIFYYLIIVMMIITIF